MNLGTGADCGEFKANFTMVNCRVQYKANKDAPFCGTCWDERDILSSIPPAPSTDPLNDVAVDRGPAQSLTADGNNSYESAFVTDVCTNKHPSFKNTNNGI